MYAAQSSVCSSRSHCNSDSLSVIIRIFRWIFKMHISPLVFWLTSARLPTPLFTFAHHGHCFTLIISTDTGSYFCDKTHNTYCSSSESCNQASVASVNEINEPQRMITIKELGIPTAYNYLHRGMCSHPSPKTFWHPSNTGPTVWVLRALKPLMGCMLFSAKRLL